MTYKIKNFIYNLMLVLLIAGALYVIVYYILAKDPNQLRELPPTFLTIVVIYVAIQLLKRFFQDEMTWYNYIYYVGLAAIITPLPLPFLEDSILFNIARVGSVFLLLSPLIEFIIHNRKKKADESIVEDHNQ